MNGHWESIRGQDDVIARFDFLTSDPGPSAPIKQSKATSINVPNLQNTR